MKHLLTAIACFFALSMSAQFPYNPDSDGDNMIGITDVLDFLPYFGMPFFPSENELVIFETGEFFGNDTVFVPENADVVMVTQIYGGDTHIQLPYDSLTLKFVILIQEGGTGGNLDILGGASGNYNATADNDWQGLAFCIRNTEGFWRCFDD